MKFSIQRQSLLFSLSLAQEVSEKSNLNSYLSYFVFFVKKESIILKSSNRQMQFIHRIESTEENLLMVEEEGEFIVPGTKLLKIVTALEGNEVQIENQNTQLLITDKNAKNIEFFLRTGDFSSYPDSNLVETKETNKISREQFLSLIKHTFFAVSPTSREQNFLSGIFFDIKENIFTAVATDRSRMSVASIETPKIKIEKEEKQDIIVPSKTISFLIRLITKYEEEEELFLMIEGNQLVIKIGDSIVASNLISGEFYDYTTIIPKEPGNQIIVDTQELKQSISRVSVAADEKQENKIKITLEENSLLVSAEEQEKSYGKEQISAETSEENTSFLVKTQHFLDPLSVIETEKTKIEYGGAKKNLIKITSAPEENTIHIVAQAKP